jgi:adenylate cyclase
MPMTEEDRNYLKVSGSISLLGAAIGFAVPYLFIPQAGLREGGIGLVNGVLITWIIALMERFLGPRLRAAPFVVELLVVSIARLAGMALAGIVVLFVLFAGTRSLPVSEALTQAVRSSLLTAQVVPIYLFGFAAIFVITFFISLSRKLGPGVLSGWAQGRYRTPRAEARVVMFLDLNDSTALAERLGVHQFSALVRDFMADLTDPILASRAQVSHYIGDEVVLTWPLTAKRKGAAWPRLLLEADRQFSLRSSYYQATYGLVPRYKAGVHAGEVVTTEVGVLKSELVHHGDVLNVGARLAGLCKEAGTTVLATKEAVEAAPEESRSLFASRGLQSLKGRAQPVEVFGMETPQLK